MAKRSAKAKGTRQFGEVLNRRYDAPVVIDRDNGIDEDKRTVELSIASDQPIDHWFGRIILDMSPGSIRLDRMRQGAPLLLNHDADKQIGVLENVRTEEGKLRATARFSRSEFANEIFQDVKDGIRRNTSVGFILHELDLEKKSDNGPNTYRSKDWEPLEGTIASVPRDTSVGVNREVDDEETCEAESADDCEMGDDCPGENAERSIPKTKSPQQIHTRSATMEKENPNGDQPQSKFVVVLARQDEFVKFARGCGGTDEQKSELETLAREYALTNKSEEELLSAINEKRSGWVTKVPPAGGSGLQLTEKEQKQYSIGRAILVTAGMKHGGEDLGVKDTNCFELEVSQDLQRAFPRAAGAPIGDFRMPTNVRLRGLEKVITRAGLDTATANAGQEFVYTEAGTFIELLRNRAMCLRLGATVLSGLQGDLEFPGQTGAGTVTWVGENPGTDVAESDLTTDRPVKLSPKIAQSTTSYSRKLSVQSIENVDSLVQNDLVTINALEVDRVAVHGSGSSFQPKGIYNQTGVNAVAMGGAPTFDKIVDLETAIAAANADIGAMAYLTTPEIRGKCKKTPQLDNTIALPIWYNGELNGYRAEATNQISKLMNGSAATGGNSHGIVFGVWPFLLFGEWGALELIVDPYRLKKQGMIEVTSYLMVDLALRYAAAFSKGTGLTVS